MYVMCLVCPTAAGMAVLAAAGMSGLDHINCVHCLLQVPGFGWQSLGSGVAVLLCRCAVGCHLWTACDWLCLTLSSCSWHRLRSLAAGIALLSLSAVGIAWFSCLLGSQGLVLSICVVPDHVGLAEAASNSPEAWDWYCGGWSSS